MFRMLGRMSLVLKIKASAPFSHAQSQMMSWNFVQAGVYVHPNSAHRSVELTGPLIGTRSLPQNFQFTDDPERRSYVGALPPISGFTERPLEPLQKASGSKVSKFITT